VLRSFGIETAADIQQRRISGIQGFGPTLVSSLMGWQQALVARFVFNPNEPINPRDLFALKAKMASRKSELEGKIRAAVASLQQASNLSLEQRRKFAEVANRTFVAAKQAELNEQAAIGPVQKASKVVSICCACFAAFGLIMNQSGVNQSFSGYNTRPPVQTSQPTHALNRAAMSQLRLARACFKTVGHLRITAPSPTTTVAPRTLTKAISTTPSSITASCALVLLMQIDRQLLPFGFTLRQYRFLKEMVLNVLRQITPNPYNRFSESAKDLFLGFDR
jgi:hypothetical protein